MKGHGLAAEDVSRRQFLASFSPFANLDADLLTAISQKAQWIKLDDAQVLFREGDPSDAVYLLREGRLEILVHFGQHDQTQLSVEGPGAIIGEIGLLCRVQRTACARADGNTTLLKLPVAVFDELEHRAPASIQALTAISRTRLRRSQLHDLLPALFKLLDETAREAMEQEIEWLSLGKGEYLFREGDPSDCVYIVINGRLRAFVHSPSGKIRGLNEMGQGEIVGEMGFFTHEPRSASVSAIRHSTVAKIDRTEFDRLVRTYPEVTMAVARRLINRLQSAQAARKEVFSLNIAVVPAQSDLRLTSFAQRFAQALSDHGTTLHLNSVALNRLAGMERAWDSLLRADPYAMRLGAWLDEQERNHAFLLLEADGVPSFWSDRCLQFADLVLVVADAGGAEELGEIAAMLAKENEHSAVPEQWLVLLHDAESEQPAGTRRWLDLTRTARHCHIRLDRTADFQRLARLVTGSAVALVLGGGGARGFAHIGAIRALEEAGVPIDMVGGTSMGAIIGAQYALGWHYQEMLRWNRKAWLEIKPQNDFTLPIISLIRGKKFDKAARMLYGERQIEDLWTNYFCVSSSLTSAEVMVHTSGLLRRAVTASASLPGITVPVIQNGNVLIDGALLNNLPTDVIRRMCGGDVIAVNVGSELQPKIEEDELPSPWKVIFSKLIPYREPIKTITIFDILMGATFVGGDSRLEELKSQADYHLRPPVDRYSLMEFQALEQIVEAGYQYTKQQIETWNENGRPGQRRAPRPAQPPDAAAKRRYQGSLGLF